MSQLRKLIKQSFPTMHKSDISRLHGILRDYIFDLEACKTPEAIRIELERLRNDLCNPVDE